MRQHSQKSADHDQSSGSEHQRKINICDIPKLATG